MITCPNCNQDNPPGSGFCLICGTDLPQPEGSPAGDGGNNCPNCKAANLEDATFCSLCGTDLQPTVAPAPQAETRTSPDKENAAQPSSAVVQLETEIARGKANADNLEQLGIEMLKSGHREQAARMMLNSLNRNQHNTELRKTFMGEFTEKELKDWKISKPPVPIWSDVVNILLYPIREGQWLNLVISAIFVTVLLFLAACASMMGMFGWGACFALTMFAIGWVLTHIGKHTKWTAVGNWGYPQMLSIDWSYFGYGFCAVLATVCPRIIAALILFKLNATAALVLQAFIGWVGSFIFPMCFLVAMLFNSGTVAFRYVFVFKSILLIFWEYLFAYLLPSVLTIAVGLGALFTLASVAAISGAAALVLSILLSLSIPLFYMYGLTIYAHLLGRIFYNNQKRLNWF